MAVASMVLGIIGLVIGWMCGGFPLSLLAIILGHVAFSKISKQPQHFTGKGMAIAGFTMGYVGLVIGTIAAIIFGATAATFAAIMEEMNRVLQQAPGTRR
jgi:uncharacterized membrane protein